MLIISVNDIDWKPKALKQIEKIKAAAVRKRIFIEVQSLAHFPDCQGVKKLANHAYSYRLRVGDYRVFFEFDECACYSISKSNMSLSAILAVLTILSCG